MMDMFTSNRRQGLALLVLLALRGLAPGAADADTPASTEPELGAISNSQRHTLNAVLKVASEELHLRGGLLACDLEGLAAAVQEAAAPSPEALEAYFASTPAAREYRSEVEADFGAFSTAYLAGYYNAFIIVFSLVNAGQEQAICEQVVQEANAHIAQQ